MGGNSISTCHSMQILDLTELCNHLPWCFFFSYAQRIIQVGRDLRRFVVRPPDQSRVSAEVRPGCSGYYSIRSWKPPRMETVQPFRTACSHAWPSLMVKKFFLIPSMDLPFFEFCFVFFHPSAMVCILSSSCHALLLRTWLHLLNNLLVCTEEQLRPSCIHFSRLNKSKSSQPFLVREVFVVQHREHLNGLMWNILHFIKVFLVVVKKSGAVF